MNAQLEVVKTTNKNPDFLLLIETFDAYLWDRYPELKNEYWGNNIIEVFNDNVILVYLDGKAAACGCFKKYDKWTVELKRMFVSPEARGFGLAQLVIKELETEAIKQGFKTMVLETLYKQTEAVSLYQKVGFTIVENYGPYVGQTNSICMSKSIL
ncbi:GNAT family N-acetyltransferase [Flavobacterium reichenbachii]|uniref:GNAT family acetyltransferase n=1 Tax=Flavobacterium reichenbachii TaxID=362418 RepID=A0A085ZLH4_9FLAO|nr:GNAT family N-acetyltransferase [Flavobacterium reichenbachii]KFF05288.1 GNAT family acetyltransferase [Flavobacterium reichenbachii]OXB16046.1 N-acetyltransferase [Flavobacterium reichenbachii]